MEKYVNKELVKYIKNKIIPVYKLNGKAHGAEGAGKQGKNRGFKGRFEGDCMGQPNPFLCISSV